MYCTKCGKQIPDNSKFCKHCGEPVGITTNRNTTSYSKTISSIVDVLGWGLCAFFSLFAVIGFDSAPITCVILAVAAVVAAPPIRKHLGMKSWLSFVLCAALFVCAMIAVPNSEDRKSDSGVSSSQADKSAEDEPEDEPKEEEEPEEEYEPNTDSSAYQAGVEAAEKFGEWVDKADAALNGEIEEEANQKVDEAVDKVNGFFDTVSKEG